MGYERATGRVPDMRRPNHQKECDKFNARVNVGDSVDYEEVIGHSVPLRYRTRSEAVVLSGHTAVVWLEGKSGCVCVSHCTPIKVKA